MADRSSTSLSAATTLHGVVTTVVSNTIFKMTTNVTSLGEQATTRATNNNGKIISTQTTTVVMKWLFVTVGILGVLSNAATMLIVVGVKKLRQQPRNWFIFHQSMADFISAVFLIAIITRPIMTSFYGIAGILACTLWMSNGTYSAPSLASAYILAAFTIEVYMAIVHPVLHKNIFNRRLVTIMVAIAWFIGMSFPTGFLFGISRVIDGVCYGNYAWNSVAVPLSAISVLVRMGIPVLIYSTCYILTFISLRRRARRVVTVSCQANNSPSQPPAMAVSMTTPPARKLMTSSPSKESDMIYSRASHNVLVTVLCTLIIHVIAWTGNQVQVLMTTHGYSLDPSSITNQIFVLLMYMNNCMNPIVYVIKYRDFRLAVKQVIPRLERSSNTTISNASQRI